MYALVPLKSIINHSKFTTFVRAETSVKVEEGLGKFLAAYNPFLEEMSQFATPIVLGFLAEVYKVRAGKRKDNPALRTSLEKAVADLEAKVQHFSGEFNALPFPEGATVIATEPCGYPLTNLYVLKLNYGAFELAFSYMNKQISPYEQMEERLSNHAVPGATLNDNVSLTLNNPIEPTWECGRELHLLKPIYSEVIGHNVSQHGRVEMELSALKGAFWSTQAWSARKSPEINVELKIETIGVPATKITYLIRNAEFKLTAVGTGELDAFLNYVGGIAATARRS